MGMLYVENVRAYYDQIVDEPDLTWLTVAMRRQHLADGYDEFRRLVRQLDPHMFISQQDIVLTNAQSYDLSAAANAVRLLGDPAGGLTGARLREIDTIGVVQGSDVISIVQEAQRIAEVLPNTTTFLGLPWAYFRYRLINTTLFFDTQINETIRLYYIGDSQVDWTRDAAGDNEFIDDLTEFHELIALLAAERYTTMDGSKRRELTEERQRLTEQMVARLQWGRSGTASRFVNNEYKGWY
jgi:hypothetical protein